MTKLILVLLISSFLSLSLVACNMSVERNEDGSLNVTARLTQVQMQEIIAQALVDRNSNGTLTVTLQEGTIAVSATGETVNGVTGTLTFLIVLSNNNGTLGVMITDVRLDGVPVQDSRVNNWNTRLQEAIQRRSDYRENATLESVSVTPAEVEIVWRVETRRSSGE